MGGNRMTQQWPRGAHRWQTTNMAVGQRDLMWPELYVKTSWRERTVQTSATSAWSDRTSLSDCQRLRCWEWTVLLTHWHEGLRRRAVTRHANAVDCVHTHLVRHPFNHSLGFVGSVGVGVKVQPHPAVAFCLFPLQHVAWEARRGEDVRRLWRGWS